MLLQFFVGHEDTSRLNLRPGLRVNDHVPMPCLQTTIGPQSAVFYTHALIMPHFSTRWIGKIIPPWACHTTCCEVGSTEVTTPIYPEELIRAYNSFRYFNINGLIAVSSLSPRQHYVTAVYISERNYVQIFSRMKCSSDE